MGYGLQVGRGFQELGPLSGLQGKGQPPFLQEGLRLRWSLASTQSGQAGGAGPPTAQGRRPLGRAACRLVSADPQGGSVGPSGALDPDMDKECGW